MAVPYVIEGTGNKEKVYDLYSRMLKDRIIFITKRFDEELVSSITAQLLFLEADNPEKDITIYINSPGGYVSTGMAIYDVMNYIKPDVSTVCLGAASSMAAFILASGAKGKRHALKHSRIMIHQVSSATHGHVEDMKIDYKETERINNLLISELAKNTGHTIKKLKKDMDRDYFMTADEAKNYGIVDDVFIMRR